MNKIGWVGLEALSSTFPLTLQYLRAPVHVISNDRLFFIFCNNNEIRFKKLIIDGESITNIDNGSLWFIKNNEPHNFHCIYFREEIPISWQPIHTKALLTLIEELLSVIMFLFDRHSTPSESRRLKILWYASFPFDPSKTKRERKINDGTQIQRISSHCCNSQFYE